MTSGTRQRMRLFALTGAPIAWVPGAALAAQGPGTGAGSATGLTQLVMAIVVYGASALIVGAGLIGALRK